ncbi:AB hydrolase superfamily protein [Paramyrothecium foliicola]|nr:AB hydrolase superfamily protein [Paramyrothecium foliicola]
MSPPKRDPTLEEAVAARPVPALPFAPESRGPRIEYLDGVRHLLPVPSPIPEVQEREIAVESRDGYQIPVVHYRPAGDAGSAEGRPLIVLFHEGGWALGDRTDEASNARLLARDLGAVCLNPEYRLAPEHPFPTGVLDCWDVIRWAARNAAHLGADPSKGFIVGGSSAGSNIASVLVHLSRRERLDPPLTGQWLSVPFLLPPELVPDKYRAEFTSMWSNNADPVIPQLAEGPDDWRTPSFVTDVIGADIRSHLFSPFAEEWYPDNATLRDTTLDPFPKTFFQVAGLDPIRDHALIYEKVLSQEWNAPTKLHLYEGYGHMFWTNWPHLQRSKDFFQDLLNGMRWLLEARDA